MVWQLFNAFWHWISAQDIQHSSWMSPAGDKQALGLYDCFYKVTIYCDCCHIFTISGVFRQLSQKDKTLSSSCIELYCVAVRGQSWKKHKFRRIVLVNEQVLATHLWSSHSLYGQVCLCPPFLPWVTNRISQLLRHIQGWLHVGTLRNA